MSKCLDLVRRNIEDLSQAELDQVLKQIQAEQGRNIAAGMDADTAAAKAGMTVADKLRVAKALQRAEYLRNRAIRMNHVAYLQTTWSHNLKQGVEAILVGSLHSQFGSRSSVTAAKGQLRRMYLAGAQHDLEATGHWREFHSGAMDLDVRRALQALDTKGDTGNLPAGAVAVAKAMQKWYETMRLNANRYGARIGKLDGYAGRQEHSPRMIRKEGEDAWTKFMQENLDFERTWGDEPPATAEKQAEWFHEAFLNVATGVRKDTGVTEREAAFSGPANLAKSMSRERSFHFKSPEAEFEYSKRFGMGTLAEDFAEHVGRMADRTGLMKVLGTNPEYNLKAIVAELLQDNRAGANFKVTDALRAASAPNGRFDRLYRTVSGQTKFVANQTLATVQHSVAAFNSVTGLGGIVLSQIGDMFQGAVAMRSQGMNFFGQLGKYLIAPIREIATSLSPPERKAFLASLGYHNEVALPNHLRFESGDDVPGAISASVSKFFKWTGATGMTDSIVLTNLQTMARYWGELAHGADYAGLSMRNKRTLDRYKIGEKEWNLLRAGIADFEGGKYLTGDAVREVDAAHFAPLAAAEIDAVKRGLAERVQKRMQQDIREQEWVDKRAKKLSEDLAAATARIDARLANADEKHAAQLYELRDKLSGLYDHIDTQNSYWQTVRDRIPSVAQVAADAVRAERAGRISRETQAKMKRAGDELMHAVAGLDERFREKWDKKFADLNREMEAGLNPDELAGRAAEMDQAFAEANALLTEKVAGMEDKGAARAQDMTDRIEQAKALRDLALKDIAKAKAAAPAAGELRRAGTSEGRAKEAAKNLKSEARQITRDLERWKKELNEDFVSRWEDRQGDLEAFADGITERINARAKETARDVGSFEPKIAEILDRTRDDMASRIQTMFSDENDTARIMPDDRTKAFLEQGTQSGTPLNAALKLFWQFKGYGHAMLTRGLLKEVYGYGSKSFGDRDIGGTLAGIGTFVAAGMAGGYVAMQLKQLAAGKEPRPVSAKSLMAATSQFGGLGIYGDFLFSQASRTGTNIYTTLGGPTVGTVQRGFDLYVAAKNGDDAKAKLLQGAINSVPGNNFWATNLAVKYFALWRLQEAMNPGYLRRLEQSSVDQTGAEWWLHPTDAAQ